MPVASVNNISLDVFASNIPAFNYEDSVDMVYKFFKEKPFYKYVVILKDQFPVGILRKEDIAFANRNLIVGEFSKPTPKIKNTELNPRHLADLIEILRLQTSDVILVNNKNQYLGIINYDTILHYLTKLPGSSQDKISNMLGKDYYAMIIGFKDFKILKENLGYKIDSLFKLIQDILKGMEDSYAHIEKLENEIQSIYRKKITKDMLKQFFEEFHKEYSILFKDSNPPIMYSIVLNLNNIKSYDAFRERIDILKLYIKNMGNTVAIIDGLQPLLFTYVSKKDYSMVQVIKEKITSSIQDIANNILKAEKNLWEYIIYDMFNKYPFYDLIYIINDSGIQISNNIINPNTGKNIVAGKKGSDRSKELYFKNASETPYITEVYLSKATDDFCITVSMAFKYQGKTYVIAGDVAYSDISKINLQE